MGDNMQYLVLSGISPYALRDLEHNRIKTIEVRSPHNFLSVLEINVGDSVFLTSASQGDLRPGTSGITAKVLEKQISTHRLIYKTDEIYEESEVQTARVQLELKGRAIVRRIERCSLGEATVVDAGELLFFEGR